MLQRPVYSHGISKQGLKKSMSASTEKELLSSPALRSSFSGALLQCGIFLHDTTNKFLHLPEEHHTVGEKNVYNLNDLENNDLNLPSQKLLPPGNNTIENLPNLLKMQKCSTTVHRSLSSPESFPSIVKSYSPSFSPLIIGRCSKNHFEKFAHPTVAEEPLKYILLERKKAYQNKINRIRGNFLSTNENSATVKGDVFIKYKIDALVSRVVKSSTRNMSYDCRLSNTRAHKITTTLESIINPLLNTNRASYKVMVQVFMGELKDKGLSFATQCNYQPTEDYFNASIYQIDNMLICVIVAATKFLNAA